MQVITELYEVIRGRRDNPPEGSYTAYLFEQGEDKILKKLGEECAETIIAAKNGDNGELTLEACDLDLPSARALWWRRTCRFADVEAELAARRAKIGNLKEMKNTDKNT